MLEPPCNCKPSNVNEFAPKKGDKILEPAGPGLGVDKLRPSRIYSFQVTPVNIIRDVAPINVHSWNSSTTQANPRIDDTPSKKSSLKMSKPRKTKAKTL